jgi:polar amino acid transport system substrate-binding protein
MMTYRVNAGALAAGSWVLGAEGGGRVLGEVCHFVDALTYLSGALPVDVRAFGAGVAGSASILIRFADGSVGTIVYAAEGDASVSKEYIEVFGQGSIARLDNFTRLTINSGGRERTVTGRQDKGQAQLVAAFLRAARGEVEAPISLEELEAVTRTTIEIDDVLRRG